MSSRDYAYVGHVQITWEAEEDKNLAIANRSRVSCAHNTLRAFIGLNITP